MWSILRTCLKTPELYPKLSSTVTYWKMCIKKNIITYLSFSIGLSLPEIVHAWIMKTNSGSARESFRMYNLHTLISSLKILPVLSQKYVMSPFRDFWESQNPTFTLSHLPPIIIWLTLTMYPRKLLKAV